MGEAFPNADEAPPLPPEADTDDGPPGVRLFFGFGTQPDSPRVIFVHRDQNFLVQTQRDLFGVNWRKPPAAPDESYPHFERVADFFSSHFDGFAGFVDENSLGPIQPTVCAVTYVNQVGAQGSDPYPFGDLPRVLSLLRFPAEGHKTLENAEDFTLSFRYRFQEGGKQLGRLHLEVAPHMGSSGHEPTYLMTLTAKGPPIGTRDKAGVLRFLEKAREWIVTGFTEATTEEAQQRWGRKK